MSSRRVNYQRSAAVLEESSVEVLGEEEKKNYQYSAPAYLCAWVDSKTKNTRLSYLHTIRALHAHVQKLRPHQTPNLLTLEYPDLATFITAKKREGNKNATLRKHAIIIRAVYGFIVDQGMLTRNPSNKLVPTKVQRRVEERLLTKEERVRLLDAAVRPVLKLILRTLYSTGLRISECLSLLKSDFGGRIHTENGSLRAVINGKGDKKRGIWIPKVLAGDLLAHCEDRTGPYIFGTQTGTSMSRQQVSKWLKITIKNAAVNKNVTCHWFRHSHATDAMRNKCPITDLQRNLGHSDIRTTQLYLHANEDVGSSSYIVDD